MSHARNDEVEIYHETFGDPADPALLLVNGLGSQCISYRVEWCEQFAAEGFLVIRFDNRDVGLSSKVTALYSLDDMAADAFAVLDAVGAQRAHVMGVSMGGMIVQAMAIGNPARVLSMTSVMSNTGEPGFGGGTAEARASLGAPPPRDRAENIEYYVARQHVIGSPGCWDDDRLRGIGGELYDRCYYPEGVAHQMMAITMSPSRDDALRELSVPTLVLHGDRDPLVDISGGIHTAEVIPGATFVVMEGMGHDYPPQYWERWVQLVTDHARAATR